MVNNFLLFHVTSVPMACAINLSFILHKTNGTHINGGN